MLDALKDIIKESPEAVIMLLILSLVAMSVFCARFLWLVFLTLGTTNTKLESINTNLVAYINLKHQEHQGQIDIIRNNQVEGLRVLDEHDKKIDNHSERIVGLEATIYPRRLNKDK